MEKNYDPNGSLTSSLFLFPVFPSLLPVFFCWRQMPKTYFSSDKSMKKDKIVEYDAFFRYLFLLINIVLNVFFLLKILLLHFFIFSLLWSFFIFSFLICLLSHWFHRKTYFIEEKEDLASDLYVHKRKSIVYTPGTHNRRLNNVYSRTYLLNHNSGMIFTTSDCIQYCGTIFTTYDFILWFVWWNEELDPTKLWWNISLKYEDSNLNTHSFDFNIIRVQIQV